MRPLLVLVSGSPGSGKTTLARRLAADQVQPLFGKDTIKEALSQVLPVDSVERSQEVGRVSVQVLDALVREELDLGVSLVVDHAFRQEFAADVLPLVELVDTSDGYRPDYPTIVRFVTGS